MSTIQLLTSHMENGESHVQFVIESAHLDVSAGFTGCIMSLDCSGDEEIDLQMTGDQ